MKIFISWSGELSKELGEIFSNWIPSVLQSVRPYFTPEDIEKGSRWSSEIAKELEESRIGIIMLTRENLLEPWITFEAGALSKELEKSKICPILFGVGNSDLVGPLVQFQATSFTREEMRKLVKTINNACDDNKLEDNVLDNVFEKWWPDLEKQVNLVMGKEGDKGETKSRTDRALIEEILGLTRMSVSRSRRELSEYLAPETIDELYIVFRELSRATEVEDMAGIKRVSSKMADIMEHILRHRITMEIARTEWERQAKIGHIGEETEKEE